MLRGLVAVCAEKRAEAGVGRAKGKGKRQEREGERMRGKRPTGRLDMTMKERGPDMLISSPNAVWPLPQLVITK